LVANVSLTMKMLKCRCRSGWDKSQDFYAVSFDVLVKRQGKCTTVGGEDVEK
jgi:hypothetical protein